MNADPQPQSRRAEIESWATLVINLVSFVAGIVLGSILIVSGQTAMWPFLFVVGLCGPTVAISVATVLRAARGRNGA